MKTLMRPQGDRTKNFAALDYNEIDKLVKALNGSNNVGALALLFTTLSVSRSGPVRAATWSEFDNDLKVWTIPAEKMKTGKEFVIPLSMPARCVLLRAQAHRTKASDLVFPSPSKPTAMISENTMRKLLQSHFPRATVHGMRSTFRTWASEIVAAEREVAEFCLAHAIGGKTEQAYNRAEHLQKREMLLEKWGLWITGDLEPFSNGNDVESYIRGRWRDPIETIAS